MSTYNQILYHIIFGTQSRKNTLTPSKEKLLYKYIAGVIQNHQCFMYIINGTENHLHILSHLHPTVPLSSLIKDIKLSSSKWIKTNKIFPHFTGWQAGYGAFTITWKDKPRIINYIKNQKEHHKLNSFKDEYQQFLRDYNIDFNTKYIP